jgi:TRAP transporter TAXI family solute receptor
VRGMMTEATESLRKIGKASLVVALSGLTLGAAKAQDLRIVTFGSAGIHGNYYAIANAICDRVNESNRQDLRCSPEPTPGSLYNLFLMERGDLDFALVQSDWQRMAFEGRGPFRATGAFEDLRGVVALYPETLTLLARRDANINTAAQLRGKIVDIGHPSTARRAINERLLRALDLSEEDFAELLELTGPAVLNELCEQRSDAALLTLGHPTEGLAGLLEECAIEIVPLEGPAIDELLSSNPDYAPAVIPASAYPTLESDVRTISVTATLLARSEVPDEVVELFTRTILEDIEPLQLAAPVIRDRTLAQMKHDGMTAPLHPGAEAAFAAAEALPSPARD